jgi:beta-N-acetylhexosaminidase
MPIIKRFGWLLIWLAEFYRIFACASEAFAQSKLDTATLRDSEARLAGAIPVD